MLLSWFINRRSSANPRGIGLKSVQSGSQARELVRKSGRMQKPGADRHRGALG